MSIKVWNGSAWVPAAAIPVWNGSSWVSATKVSVWDGLQWAEAWPATSTVSVTGPANQLSADSGSTGPMKSIAAAVFTVTLSNPSAVSKVELQFYRPGVGWEAPSQTWNDPATAELTYSTSFTTRGTWYARATITIRDDLSTATSSSHTFSVQKKSLTVSPSTTTPAIGSSMTITAGCADDCPGWQTSSGWYYSYDGSSWTYYSTGNPMTWTNVSGAARRWTYRENFPDGSYISAPYTTVTPTVVHFHEVVPTGSSRAAIQAAMDRAYNHFITYQGATTNFDSETTMACVELVAGGTYNLDGTALRFRRGVRLIGGGSGATRPLVKASSASHLMNVDNNGGGSYNSPHYDWLVENIRFDCNNYVGGFAICHTRRFRIKGCDFSNLGGNKHYIEINSSGGARNDNTYNAQVYNCYFVMTNTTPTNAARRTLDECIQLDYSWPGSTYNTANDGTMTNNVVIQGCYFDRVPRAIGGHRFDLESGNASPKGLHSNILIQSNTFSSVQPNNYGDGTTDERWEGAVRGYMWRYVRLISNTWQSCTQPLNFYSPGDAAAVPGVTSPGQYYVQSNIFRSSTATTRPIVNAHAASGSPLHEQCLAENNTFDGTWNTNDFAIDFADTGTETLPASSFGVVIRWNTFKPDNLTLQQEKDYNKYSRNTDPMVYVYENYVSDGTVDNS